MTPPSLFSATGLLLRLQLTSLWRGRKLRVGMIATGFVVFAVIAARYSSQRDVGADRAVELAREAMVSGFDWGFFRLLVLLLPFLFCASSLSEEIEGRTLPFLTVRPVGRVPLALGKFLAGAICSLGCIWAAGILMHLVGLAASPAALIEVFPDTLRALGAASLLIVCYCAICTMWAVMIPDASGVICALWLAILEFVVSLLPGQFRVISMATHGRSLGGMEVGGWLAEQLPPPEVPAAISAGLIAGMTLLALLVALLVVRGAEYRFSKA